MVVWEKKKKSLKDCPYWNNKSLNVESLKHGETLFGRDFGSSCNSNFCSEQGQPNDETRLLQTWSCHSWKISKDGEYTILLGNLFCYSSALRGKVFVWTKVWLSHASICTCCFLPHKVIDVFLHVQLYKCISRVHWHTLQSYWSYILPMKVQKICFLMAYFCIMEIFASSFISSSFNKTNRKIN